MEEGKRGGYSGEAEDGGRAEETGRGEDRRDEFVGGGKQTHSKSAVVSYSFTHAGNLEGSHMRFNIG